MPFGTSGAGYSVSETTDGDQLNEQTVLITYELHGRTEPGNTLEIDGKPLIVKPDGTFKAMLELKRGNTPYGILVRNNEGMTRILNLIVTVNDRDEAAQLIDVKPASLTRWLDAFTTPRPANRTPLHVALQANLTIN